MSILTPIFKWSCWCYDTRNVLVLHREGLLDQNLKYLTCVQHVGTVLLSVVREILKYSLLITVGKGTRMSRIDIIRVILVASRCVESSIRG
jgi:hypothetical protein